MDSVVKVASDVFRSSARENDAFDSFSVVLGGRQKGCPFPMKEFHAELRAKVGDAASGKPFTRKFDAAEGSTRVLFVNLGEKTAYLSTKRVECAGARLRKEAAELKKNARFPVFQVKMGEMWLMKGNQKMIVGQFLSNLQEKLAHKASFIKRDGFAIIVRPLEEVANSDEEMNKLENALTCMPGAFSVVRSQRLPCTEAALVPEIRSRLASVQPPLVPGSFVQVGIAVDRSNATWQKSIQLRPALTKILDNEFDLRFTFSKNTQSETPELYLDIRVTPHNLYVATGRGIPAIGGQPTGRGREVNKVVALLSGGMDSPVAAYSMCKRGCTLILTHFQNVNQMSEAAVKDKIVQLAEVLSKYQTKLLLYIVPFAELQNEIIQKVPAASRMLVYRLFMLRIAGRIAREHRARFLVTGDSMNQVASQTSSNLDAMYNLAPKPVLAPLIAANKDEIITIAKQIGTFDISSLPYGDCCSHFIAEHPNLFIKERDLKEFGERICEETEKRAFVQSQILSFAKTGDMTEVRAMHSRESWRSKSDIPVSGGGACAWTAPSAQKEMSDTEEAPEIDSDVMSTSDSRASSEVGSMNDTTRTKEVDPGEEISTSAPPLKRPRNDEPASRAPPVTYFDNAATTRALPEVIDAVVKFMGEEFGNPHSPHGMGTSGSRAVEETRQIVADALGARSSEIYFTSGGTESNNLAIKGACMAALKSGRAGDGRGEPLDIVTTHIEHASVLEVCRSLERVVLPGTVGFRVRMARVSAEGVVDVRHLESLLTARTVVVSVMHVNNEIGSIQPIETIAALCNSRNILFHTDACQSFGKLPLRVSSREHKIDLVSINAHKMHGPKGVGALYVRQGTTLWPMQHGGGQEQKLRSGTVNVPGVVGFGKATEIAMHGMTDGSISTPIRELRDYMWTRIRAEFPNAQLNGPPVEDGARRVCNNLSVWLGKFDGENVVLFLTQRFNVCCSTGSACSTNDKNEPSHVIVALGRSKQFATQTLRFGLSRYTQRSDCDRLLAGLVAFRKFHEETNRVDQIER
eukprot:204320_1